MKKSLRSVALAMLLLSTAAVSSCHKKTDIEPATTGWCGTVDPNPSSAVTGRWELTQTTGGLAGLTIPADPSHKREIAFAANGQASFFLNGVVACSSAYSVAADSAYTTGKPERFIRFSTTSCEPGRKYISAISAAELVLSEDYADGQAFHYVRRSVQP